MGLRLRHWGRGVALQTGRTHRGSSWEGNGEECPGGVRVQPGGSTDGSSRAPPHAMGDAALMRVIKSFPDGPGWGMGSQPGAHTSQSTSDGSPALHLTWTKLTVCRCSPPSPGGFGSWKKISITWGKGWNCSEACALLTSSLEFVARGLLLQLGSVLPSDSWGSSCQFQGLSHQFMEERDWDFWVS